VFELDVYQDYVKVQTEAAVRGLASRYPYDAHDDEKTSLRGSSAEVTATLKGEIQERLGKAGVSGMEARLSHLAYAPEIAAVMLPRPQAAAGGRPPPSARGGGGRPVDEAPGRPEPTTRR